MFNISANIGDDSIAGRDLTLSIDDIADARSDNQILEDHFELAKAKRFEIDTGLRKHLAYCFTGIIFLWFASVICILFFNANL